MRLAPGQSAERIEELLTGRLTPEALDETASIFRAWALNGLPPGGTEQLRRIGGLLDGAGNWISGWEECVEALRARQMPEGESAWAYSDR